MFMRKIKCLLIFIVCICVPQVYASDDVAGAWASLSIKKNFNHGLGLTFRGEYRAKENLTSTDVFFLRLTGSYKPCPYFSTALAYDFLGSPQKGGDYGALVLSPYLKQQHRILFDLQEMYKVGQWSFLFRQRFLSAYASPLTVVATDSLGQAAEASLLGAWTHILRLYPQVTYAIPNSRWAPYLGVEFYDSLKPGERFFLQQYHLFAGTSFKINDMHTLQFAYVLQHKTPTRTPSRRIHTLCVNYILSL